MKIMVFTEGTVLMHKSAEGKDREQIVEQSRREGIQREESSLKYESKSEVPVEQNSVYDFANYLPNGKATEKLWKWKDQKASIYYLSSRRIKSEVEAIKTVLKRYNFPDSDNLLFRQEGANYKDVAEKNLPDILIEDDCESIGGEVEMTYPHIREDLKPKIKSIIVKEFAGIDNLPDDLIELNDYNSNV